MTTLHFRAEGFEATATEVAEEHLIVTASGRVPYSLQLGAYEHVEDMDTMATKVTHDVFCWTERGWHQLCSTDGKLQSLALAISLLYSVPGVEWVER